MPCLEGSSALWVHHRPPDARRALPRCWPQGFQSRQRSVSADLDIKRFYYYYYFCILILWRRIVCDGCFVKTAGPARKRENAKIRKLGKARIKMRKRENSKNSQRIETGAKTRKTRKKKKKKRKTRKLEKLEKLSLCGLWKYGGYCAAGAAGNGEGSRLRPGGSAGSGSACLCPGSRR